MNYYIQGDAANADQIKAAFEKLGYKTIEYCFNAERTLYFTFGDAIKTATYEPYKSIIKTNPNYQELELPKPHYDIANFKPFDKVLVRDGNCLKWAVDLFSYIDDGFVCTGGIPCSQCIPFEGNEHLLGTTDMPDEMYINW